MKRKFKKRKKVRFQKRRPKPGKDITFDYKEPATLLPFLTEQGKILPRRVSGLNALQQLAVAIEVKRCRQVALLPYCTVHINDFR